MTVLPKEVTCLGGTATTLGQNRRTRSVGELVGAPKVDTAARVVWLLVSDQCVMKFVAAGDKRSGTIEWYQWFRLSLYL